MGEVSKIVAVSHCPGLERYKGAKEELWTDGGIVPAFRNPEGACAAPLIPMLAQVRWLVLRKLASSHSPPGPFEEYRSCLH